MSAEADSSSNPAWLEDSVKKEEGENNSSSSPSAGAGANEDGTPRKQSSAKNSFLDAALLGSGEKGSGGGGEDSATPLKQVATGEYHSPSKGDRAANEGIDDNSLNRRDIKRPSPPPEPRNSGSAGAGRGRTPPSQNLSSSTSAASPPGVLSLGAGPAPQQDDNTASPVAAGSGMAPSLLQRRKKKMEESLNQSTEREEEEPIPPPPQASAPKSLVQQALAASPSRAGLPLSLSPRKTAGDQGGESPGNGLVGLNGLPSAEVQDIEYQLAALRSVRRPQTEGSDGDTTPTTLPPKKSTPPSEGLRKQNSGKESPRQAKFGRRAGGGESGETDDSTTRRGSKGDTAATAKTKGGPSSSSSTSGNDNKSPAAGSSIDMSRIVKNLQSSNWQDQTQGLNSLRDVLRSIQPSDSAAATAGDDAPAAGPVESVRQQLHDCVHGVLTMCESPRSSVSKLAMDTVGLLCRSVTLRNTGGSGSGATKHQSNNTIDHFIEPISSKLVLKGGSTSAKFLFDSALFSLRELLESVTNSTRAMSGLLSITGVKTEKSKVLWAEAIGHCLEVSTEAGSQCFASKEYLSKCISVLDGFLHDAWPDVRDGGRKIARILHQDFKESTGLEDLCYTVCRAVESTIRREVVIQALELDPAMVKRMEGPGAKPPTPRTTSTPRGTPRGSARSSSSENLKKDPSLTPRGGTGSAEEKKPSTPPKIPPPPSSGKTAAGKPPLSGRGGAKRSTTPRNTPPAEGEGAAAGGRAAPKPAAKKDYLRKKDATATSTTDRGKKETTLLEKPKMIGKGAESEKEAEKKKKQESSGGSASPGRPGPSPPNSSSGVRYTRSISSADSSSLNNSSNPPPPSDGGRSNGTSPVLQSNNSFFTTTLGQESKQHGAFSTLIVSAADGNWKERADSMQKIESLCHERALKSSQHAEKPLARSSNEPPTVSYLESKTALALCDVIALRCADTNVQVQQAALSCSPPLLKLVPGDCIDATSSKWISCLTTALGSRNESTAGASKSVLDLVLNSCTPSETKGVLQCLSTTMVSVRNPFAKATLIRATQDVLWSPVALDQGADVGDDDTRFLLEMGVKLLSDDRAEIEPVAKDFIACLVQSRSEATTSEAKKRNKFLLEERVILDHPSIPTRCWDDLKDKLGNRD